MSNAIIKTIRDILVTSGKFLASDIEKQISYSRGSLNKTLRDLVSEEVLLMSPRSGAAVKYRLHDNEKALRFLFVERNGLMIEDLARAWGARLQTATLKANRYVAAGLLLKHGLPPKKIVYELLDVFEQDFSPEQKKVIEKYYAYVTPDGRLLKGIQGFSYWFKNKSGRKDIKQLAQEYLDVRRKYYQGQVNVSLISATDKINQVFGADSQLSGLFHRDFDALPIFGKTYLSRMVGIAKSGRANATVMNYIVDSITESIQYLLKNYQIQAVAFIPPTVSRKVQILDYIAKKLQLSLPTIKLEKKSGLVPVQQKSLKNINDRILNAKNTIVVVPSASYDNVLLIDDVTGSGATLNETARKFLEKGIAQKVLAFTVTGSAEANDFEVISEV